MTYIRSPRKKTCLCHQQCPQLYIFHPRREDPPGSYDSSHLTKDNVIKNLPTAFGIPVQSHTYDSIPSHRIPQGEGEHGSNLQDLLLRWFTFSHAGMRQTLNDTRALPVNFFQSGLPGKETSLISPRPRSCLRSLSKARMDMLHSKPNIMEAVTISIFCTFVKAVTLLAAITLSKM